MIIGIDLGTTNSLAAYMTEDGPKIIPNRLGNNLTPSVVAMDKDGNIFIKGRCKTMILSANGQNIFPEELEAVLNSIDFVGDSVVVDRNSKLVALITLDKEAIKRAGLDDASVAELPEKIRVKANRVLPVYSKLTKIEVKTEPFEKTPKGSIKRFLYS